MTATLPSTGTTELRSRRLGVVDVDRPGIREDLATIDALPARSTYSEYSFGSWSSHVLANGTGDEHDREFRPHDGHATTTALGRRLPALMELVHETFTADALRWVRVFTLTDGLLIPHVDFIEFDVPLTRVQVPLRTTAAALHSEQDSVMHLRKGEIWWLEARLPHAAFAPPGPARLALALDFAASPGELGDCLRDPREPDAAPALLERPPLAAGELDALLQLGLTLDRACVRDVLRLLATVHFRRRAHAADCFGWLVEAAGRSGQRELEQRAAAFRVYCLERREHGERFAW